jgi:ferredoxin
VNICPKNVIKIVPKASAAIVHCSSKNKGAVVRQICDVGCIGCGICVKACPKNCITMEDNLATIDRTLCTSCGVCAAKCPRKIISIE